ncbi:hypothetical protein AYI68_g1924, partial [Smittium mucronatum]
MSEDTNANSRRRTNLSHREFPSLNSVYAELSEALPSIDEDFFRTPLSDEDHNTALYTCPKTCSMNYFPPPLNESALTAVKELNSTLNIQDNPGIDVTDDPDITFANTMRVLLSDIANSLVNKKTETHKRRAQPFCKRQEVSVSYDNTSSNVTTAHNTSAASTSAPNNRPQKSQKKFRGRGRGRWSHERGIQDPIQETIPHEAKIGQPDTHDHGRVEKENSKKWSGSFTAEGGSKFSGWPSSDITPAAEQEEVIQGSEQHSNEGSIVAAGKARHRGSTAT